MTDQILDKCPTAGCPAKGPDVYLADAHPLTCAWMMNNVHRCAPHDDLLMPGEQSCPNPSAPFGSRDPHNRLGSSK